MAVASANIKWEVSYLTDLQSQQKMKSIGTYQETLYYKKHNMKSWKAKTVDLEPNWEGLRTSSKTCINNSMIVNYTK